MSDLLCWYMMLRLPSTRDVSLYILRPSQKKPKNNPPTPKKRKPKNWSHFARTQEEVEACWAQQMIFIVGLHNPTLASVPTLWVISLSASHEARGIICKQLIPVQVCIGCGLLPASCFSFSGILHIHTLQLLSASELSQRQAPYLPPYSSAGS